MMLPNHVASLRVAVLSTFLAGALAVGCANRVAGGGSDTGGEGGHSGEGGAQDGTGGQSGGESSICTAYAGDGCKPGELQECSGLAAMYDLKMRCQLVPNEPCKTAWSYSDCNTPLVLSFDGAPVEYLVDGERTFDLSGLRSQVTDWPTAHTPWLALDRNGNGAVDDGSELFGSMTVLSSGRRAANGFIALRELDADGDGRLTPSDPGFSQLLVWSDRDGDRRSTEGELTRASAFTLLSIDLEYTVDPRCDARGNCEVERAAFRYRDAAGVERTGAVVDIHLAAQHE